MPLSILDRRAYARAWYANNRERVRDYQSKRDPDAVRAQRRVSQGRRVELSKAYADSLRVGGCVDCGTKNLAVLDFDHLRDKQHQVSNMRYRSFAEIEAEAAKCEVRCANCHRVKTAERRLAVAS